MFYMGRLKTIGLICLISLIYALTKYRSLFLFYSHSKPTAGARNLDTYRLYTSNDNDDIMQKSTFVLDDSLKTYDPFSLKVPLPFRSDYRNPCFTNEDSKLYCLPYFFLLASQKSGTTDLWFKLENHPMIADDSLKEYHWWNRGRFPLLIKNTNLTFSQYMDWYNESTKAIKNLVVVQRADSGRDSKYHPMIFGDGTAGMLYDQLQWRRIPQNAGLKLPNVITAHTIRYILPEAKFIVILRNPSIRLFSDYCYYNEHRANPNNFHDMVVKAIAEFDACRVFRNRSCLYDPPDHIDMNTKWHPDFSWDPVVRLRASLYSEFLADWFKVFDRDQFYIFTMEEYSSNRLHYMNEIFQFLGLEPLNRDAIPTHKLKTINRKTNCVIPFYNKTKDLLDNFYRPFNFKLAALLKDDKYHWLDE